MKRNAVAVHSGSHVKTPTRSLRRSLVRDVDLFKAGRAVPGSGSFYRPRAPLEAFRAMVAFALHGSFRACFLSALGNVLYHPDGLSSTDDAIVRLGPHESHFPIFSTGQQRYDSLRLGRRAFFLQTSACTVAWSGCRARRQDRTYAGEALLDSDSTGLQNDSAPWRGHPYDDNYTHVLIRRSRGLWYILAGSSRRSQLPMDAHWPSRSWGGGLLFIHNACRFWTEGEPCGGKVGHASDSNP